MGQLGGLLATAESSVGECWGRSPGGEVAGKRRGQEEVKTRASTSQSGTGGLESRALEFPTVDVRAAVVLPEMSPSGEGQELLKARGRAAGPGAER